MFDLMESTGTTLNILYNGGLAYEALTADLTLEYRLFKGIRDGELSL